MYEGESDELRAVLSALGMRSNELGRLVPGLNALGAALLTARARGENIWTGAATVFRSSALGLTCADCRNLHDRGVILVDGKHDASRRVVLSDYGLVVLRAAIPLGAMRPVYAGASRGLSVAGHVIAQLKVQARNLCAVLTSLELAQWAPRVEKPLAGRPCAADPHSLQVALGALNARQRVIDFHVDDGAATWNWRPEGTSKS